MIGRCYFCKGRVSEQKVKVDFHWGEELVVIEDVPAEVCEQCGEKYLDADVYREMEILAKGRVKPVRHATVSVFKFEHPVPAR